MPGILTTGTYMLFVYTVVAVPPVHALSADANVYWAEISDDDVLDGDSLIPVTVTLAEHVLRLSDVSMTQFGVELALPDSNSAETSGTVG